MNLKKTKEIIAESVRKIKEGCGGFSSITNDYLMDDRLTLKEKSVYATLFAITHNSDHPDYCFPSQSTLAALMKISVRTLQRYLKLLVKCGYIIIKRRGSTSNLYYIVAKMGKEIVKSIKERVGFQNGKDQQKQYNKSNNRKGNFNNYTTREYNFDELEKQLLSWEDTIDLDGSHYDQLKMT